MKKRNDFLGISSNIWIILILAFIYLPILYVIIYSFNETKSLTVFTGFSTRWYQKMFTDRPMLEAIYNTVIVAVLATAISTVIGTITAIGLSKQKKIVREIVLQVNELPVLNPDIVTAIGLMLLFISLNIETSFWTLLLAHITFCIPYVILAILPRLRMLDDNVAEAALDLGATPFQALTKVIIPQILPAILSGALIAFTMSFDDFIISFFTAGSDASNISIYVYSMSKRINPSINALSTLIVVAVTIGLVLANIIPRIKENKKEKEIVQKQNKWLLPILASLLVIGFISLPLLIKKQSELDPIEMFGSDTLNVFNAGEYIGEDVISNFEEMYGVKVNYTMFDSNEAMYTKLMSGASYDVIVPSDYMIERLISDKMLQPIDKNIVDNLDLLTEGVKNLSFDPDNTYCVPYFWGTVGIVYDQTVIPSEKVEELGWEIFRDEEYKGDAFFYNSERDSFMVALKALGYSMNTTDLNEIEDAYNWLLDMKHKLEPSIVTDEVIDGMINGEKALAYVYSGDAAYILSENEDMRFFEPMQGTNSWVDAMVIPKNAQNPILANYFIKYITEYDAAYDNSSYVGYTSPNQEVLDELSSEDGDYFENEAYQPRTSYELDECFHDNEEIRRIMSEKWVKVTIN